VLRINRPSFVDFLPKEGYSVRENSITTNLLLSNSTTFFLQEKRGVVTPQKKHKVALVQGGRWQTHDGTRARSKQQQRHRALLVTSITITRDCRRRRRRRLP